MLSWLNVYSHLYKIISEDEVKIKLTFRFILSCLVSVVRAELRGQHNDIKLRNSDTLRRPAALLTTGESLLYCLHFKTMNFVACDCGIITIKCKYKAPQKLWCQENK